MEVGVPSKGQKSSRWGSSGVLESPLWYLSRGWLGHPCGESPLGLLVRGGRTIQEGEKEEEEGSPSSKVDKLRDD